MLEIMEKVENNITVNIGTSETVSISQLVNLICKISGKKPSIIFDTSKPEGRFIKSSDTSLLEEIIKEKIITIELEEGIRRMISWYKENF